MKGHLKIIEVRKKNSKEIIRNKPLRNKDGLGRTRQTWITIDELEKFKLDFSRCTNVP